MNSDELLIARLEDKIRQAADNYMLTAGDFLDMHQRKIAEDYCKSRKLPVRHLFYGGYAEAERCMPVFLPDYIEMPDAAGTGAGAAGAAAGAVCTVSGAAEAAGAAGSTADSAPAAALRVPDEIAELLRVVRVTAPKGGRTLSHRDYLGSLLALGLDREVTGDILVRQPDAKTGGGADIIVEAGVAEFIELNYDRAGRTNLTVEILPIASLDTGAVNIAAKRDTVASLRLDNIVSSAFAVSRAKAAEAIRRGIVSVNSVECLKVDQAISEGDRIVLRGKGKIALAEVGGRSRKDRIVVTYDIYK